MTVSRRLMMATSSKGRYLAGTILRPAASIGHDYSARISAELELMRRDVIRTLSRVWRETAQDGAAMDASPASQSRIAINALLRKWGPRFDRLAKTAADRMTERVLKNSTVTLGGSLKSAAEGLTLNADYMTDRIGEIVKAGTEQAANLIRLLPGQTLGAVQGDVMRAITEGQGLAELVPKLQLRYQAADRHAQLTAQDQVRKAYGNITAAKMRGLGIKRFEWVHSGGGQHPRKDHQRMNGKIYELDNPPLIGRMYGEDVYGKPGDLPNCRCTMRPILDFNFDDND